MRGVVVASQYNRVISYGDDGVVRVWRLPDWKMILEVILADSVYEVAVLEKASHELLLTAVGRQLRNDSDAVVFNASSDGILVDQWLEGKGRVGPIAVASGTDGTVRLGYPSSNGSLVSWRRNCLEDTPLPKLMPLAIEMDSRNERIYVGGGKEQGDHPVLVFDSRSKKLIGELTGARGAVRDLKMISGTDLVVAACEDGTILAWHVGDMSERLECGDG